MKNQPTPARKKTARKRTAGERCSVSAGWAPFFVRGTRRRVYIMSASLGDQSVWWSRFANGCDPGLCPREHFSILPNNSDEPRD